MNRFSSFAGAITVLFMVILFCLPAFAQTIKVTMRLNTATNRDTLRANHVVQIRGEATGTVTPAITWDQNTGIILHNIGGDYWETTFQIQAGATMRYKFWTGFNSTQGTFFWDGWEGPIIPANPVNSGDNRLFIAGNRDTTLSLQFYHGTDASRDQYWRPYAAKPDSFTVYLRVNMAAFMETKDFDPDAGDRVVVRGSAPLDPTNTWNTLIPLTRETGSADNGAFFSGAGYIANNAVNAGNVQSFKFVYYKGTSPVWESTPDRVYTYSGAKDTTIHWAYFNNQKPTGGNVVSATLTWQMNTDGLEKLGLFNRIVGDRVVVDGAKAWDVANAIQLNYVPLLGRWVAQEPFIKAPGAVLEYKTVLLWDSSRVDPASPNFIPGLALETNPLQYWEGPGATGTGNRNYTYTNQTAQAIPGDLGFEFQFFNSFPEEGVIETPITITYNIDMRPATNVATNPSNPLFRPGIDTVWVQLIDCLLPLTQGEGIYANTPLMLEDKDGDLVYSASWALTPPVPYDAAFRINYSSTGGIIQNGGGFTSGRSYYQYIHPTKVNADGSIVWPSTFSFPTLPWMDSDLTVEDPPNLFTPTAVEESEEGTAIRTFKLSQNYPNPFWSEATSRFAGNPGTTIDYEVAEKSHVRISVYNLMGQLVATLVNEQQLQGTYSVEWNGKDPKGNQAPSGIYFVKMAAGSFEQLRKMTLIR
jgi:hypothetical protein